ncbi:PREDICTED: centriole, cilia and spindle-associated protein-like [Branchiostoma belcheri]|uniref:Centriole, cilia and spindle-associated protein-like n=1 Tax=Branchiostoma belcheri TaxID=7741 RepID=A0A6P5A9A4_BRABE|nr:PREDICTED: centriole, cilia and spindle-associated protein-like [Branchiostoma belcheri]
MGVKASPKKTEYSKQYRGPRWADQRFLKLWEDNVDYRVQRRRVEHSHTPWAWARWDNGDDTDSSSEEGGPQTVPIKEEQSRPPAEQSRPPAERIRPPAEPRRDQEVQTPERWVSERRHVTPPGQGHDAGDSHPPPHRPAEARPPPASLGKTRVISTKARPSRPVSAPVRRKPPPPRPSLNPPFLAYGGGDRERVTGDKRTFNVRASVRNNEEVYLSALRALRRREMQVKSALEARHRDAQRRVALSRSRTVPPPRSDTSQWRTEYQSNYQPQSAA